MNLHIINQKSKEFRMGVPKHLNMLELDFKLHLFYNSFKKNCSFVGDFMINIIITQNP